MATFDEYKQDVLAEFDRQLAIGKLPSTWANATPADLKRGSVRACEERFKKKDEPMLQLFFGQKADTTAYRNAIQNHNANPFRPLSDFLRDRSRNPRGRIIELLAWLIDYEPRPWRYEYPAAETKKDAGQAGPPETTTNPPGGTVIQEPEEKSFVDPPPPPPTKGTEGETIIDLPPLLKRKLRAVPIVLGILVIAAIITFLTKHGPAAPQKCMYWADDHYQLVGCEVKIEGAQIIALDSIKMARFKKITRPDTLTAASIGKAWYSDINHNLEFFTDSGLHPLYPDRRLLHLTYTILNNHSDRH